MSGRTVSPDEGMAVFLLSRDRYGGPMQSYLKEFITYLPGISECMMLISAAHLMP